jgi:purine-nucleoside phosphorylase
MDRENHGNETRSLRNSLSINWNDQEAVMRAIDESAGYIAAKSAKKADIAVVLGSGLGAFADNLHDADVIPYGDIPFFSKPTVSGHGGTLHLGTVGGKRAAVMRGRMHYYEGYDTREITFPVRVLARLGITSIVLTNACGGVNKRFHPGDLMIIEDHIGNFCPSPLRGANLDIFGERFIDMSAAYTPAYIEIAERTAAALGIPVQKGVYGYWPGPAYETAAEIRAYMALGADVVGQSTVAETIVARHCGMRVLGLSLVTNMTCVYSRGGTSHEEVIEMGKNKARDFITLLEKIIERIP